jgi:hypothetical protein
VPLVLGVPHEEDGPVEGSAIRVIEDGRRSGFRLSPRYSNPAAVEHSFNEGRVEQLRAALVLRAAVRRFSKVGGC